jgi:hypothetical protein
VVILYVKKKNGHPVHLKKIMVGHPNLDAGCNCLDKEYFTGDSPNHSHVSA